MENKRPLQVGDLVVVDVDFDSNKLGIDWTEWGIGTIMFFAHWGTDEELVVQPSDLEKYNAVVLWAQSGQLSWEMPELLRVINDTDFST